jgi:hypothetical protein
MDGLENELKKFGEDSALDPIITIKRETAFYACRTSVSIEIGG